MKITQLQQKKCITNIIHHTEIQTKCLISIGKKEFTLTLTIRYEDYYGGENYLLSVMVEKLNPWDESCQVYMDLETYIQNCLQKICPEIDNRKASKQLMKFVEQILNENQIINLWE